MTHRLKSQPLEVPLTVTKFAKKYQKGCQANVLTLWVSFHPYSRFFCNVLTRAPLSRFAHNHLGLQHQSLRLWRHLGVQNPQCYSRSFFSDSPALLIDTGEWNTQGIIVVEISAAHDRQVLGDSNSVIQCRIHGTHCQRIIEAE